MKAVGGGLLAFGNTDGAGVRVWECFWGRVRAGVLGGSLPPPLPLQAIPCPQPLAPRKEKGVQGGKMESTSRARALIGETPMCTATDQGRRVMERSGSVASGQ